MEVPFEGRCACATVEFQCGAYPLAMYNCHCRACQRTSGAPYVPMLVMNADKVKISGNLRLLKSYVHDDPHPRRAVCQECRSVLFAADDNVPEILLVHAMALEDPSEFRPIADIWTSDAQAWVGLDTHIPKVFKSPPILGNRVVWQAGVAGCVRRTELMQAIEQEEFPVRTGIPSRDRIAP